MIKAEIQHISSDTNGEYNNLKLSTKDLMTAMTNSRACGTEICFYQTPREDIQGIVDKLNAWLEVN